LCVVACIGMSSFSHAVTSAVPSKSETISANGTSVGATKSTALVTGNRQLALELKANQINGDHYRALSQIYQKKLQKLNAGSVTLDMLKQASTDLVSAQMEQSSAALGVSDLQENIGAMTDSLRELEEQLRESNFIAINSGQKPDAEFIATLQSNIDAQRALLQLLKKRLQILVDAEHLAGDRVQLQQQWSNTLQISYDSSQRNLRQQALKKAEAALQDQQQSWLKQLIQFHQTMQHLMALGQADSPEYERASLRAYEAEIRGNAARVDISIARAKKQVDDLLVNEQEEHAASFLYDTNHRADHVLSSLVTLHQLLTDRINLLKAQKTIEVQVRSGATTDATLRAQKIVLIGQLLTKYQQQDNEVLALQELAEARRLALIQKLKEALGHRQPLMIWHVSGWNILGRGFLRLVNLTIQSVINVQTVVFSELSSMPWWRLSGLGVLLASWLGLWYWAAQHLKEIKPFSEVGKTMIGRLTWIVRSLFRRNLFVCILFGMLVTVFAFTGLTQVSSYLIPIALVWVGIRCSLGLARLFLLENLGGDEGHDVRLYQQLRIGLVAGGIVLAFYVLGEQFDVAYQIQDFVTRLLMVFLAAISLFLMKGWRIIPELIVPHLNPQRVYLRRVIYLIAWLVPATIFLDASLGIVGYIQLALTISRYAGVFLLVLCGFLIARGFLKDGVEWMASLLIRKVRNGWLWSEALLKPLDKLGSLGLLFTASSVLFSIYGWDRNSYVVTSLIDLMNRRLFRIGVDDFTLLGLVECGFVLAILYWTTHWSREFAYRWLFARTKDQGLRNSLAVFTQYAIVVLGALVGLKVLGLDLSAITFIFTGLALGAGLGLRDLANNFVSGMLLLIERPVRKGDIVTVDGQEGTVTHIGMRAVTIRANDRTEVIVPNASILSKTFNNYTLRDGVVRAVINIRATRSDDPRVICDTLLTVMKATLGVLEQPQPEVYFTDMQDSLFNFEARYFINISAGDMRSQIRAQLLHSIWDRFRELGIRAPHGEQDVYLRSFPVSKSMRDDTLLSEKP